MKKSMKGLFAFVGCAAITTAVTYCTADFIYKYGTKRDFPKSFRPKRKKISEKHELIAKMRTAGKKFIDSQPYETAVITSNDGLKLYGHIIMPFGEVKRTLVMVHGWRRGWDDTFGIFAPFLLENNTRLLIIEQRSQGESEGDHIGLGLLEKDDVIKWTQFADRLGRGACPIYLFGISMGASAVLLASGEPLPSNVCGIISDCGFTSPKDIAQYMIKKDFHLWPHPLISIINKKCAADLGIDMSAFSTLKALEKNKLPILFIHGKSDKFVPTSMTIMNYNACKAPKELFLVEDAAHCQSYFMAKHEYEELVLNFFKKHDPK